MAEEPISAVYVSWITFKNAIEGLAQGVPNQIDRSSFPGLSGGVQNQLFSALKFLGLTNEASKPTPELHALAAADEAGRKQQIKKILEERYADLFALDLSKTTPDELSKTMAASYSVSGDTREKAVRFFLSAVQYVGIPVSRFLSKAVPGAAANGRPARTRRTTRPRASENNPLATDAQKPANPAGTSRAVTLRSGGTLTLAATLDLFSLSTDDRKFVFELIDKLEEYAKNNPDAKP